MRRLAEKIACPCWLVRVAHHDLRGIADPVVLPIPTNMLMMDHYNQCIKSIPDFGHRVDRDIHYITTHGRVVTGREAFLIALNGNQLRDEKAINGELDPLDIWPRS